MRSSPRRVALILALLGQIAGPFAAVAQTAPDSEQAQARAPRDGFYCDERKLGTWFYCDPEKAREAEKAAAAPQPAATQRIAAIQAQLEELKAKAVLDPSTENITAYIHYQREQLDRASTFADVWSRAVWQNPELDYSLQRPISTLGKRAWMDQRKNDRAATLSALSKRYGVFYFYSSSCGACEIFSPILKSVSDQYGMSVLPVSMDGGPNTAFPNYVVNTGQYQRLGLEGGQVPAVVLFDTVTKKPIPIGYGILSADDIMSRIFTLTNVEPGSDY